MMSLHELQRAFVDGVLFDDSRVCATIFSHDLEPQRRLDIYRNNAREGFLRTLEATFPVVVRLAGADWFRQTGTQYWRAHPSHSGNLHHVGARFADWLEPRLADTPHAYFADVARLEWAYQEVLVAADHPSFDVTALAAIAPDDYGALRFEIHPASRLVASEYPVLEIWKANQPGADADRTLRLDSGASRVLIIRRDDHVELRELSPGDFALLQAFARGENFAAAADTALHADPNTDLGASLARIMQCGALVDFDLHDTDTPHCSSYPPSAIR